jgi:NifU-like protein involved in Fe-S cluster formation
MGTAGRLYTPELLGLAVELVGWPPLESVAARGEARSPTCGSTLALDLALDSDARIERLGMRVRACAVGQAAAAIFAGGATGRDRREIDGTMDQLASWLEGGGPLPDWPRISAIAAARDYPGRHGAIMLPWKAALAALSSPGTAG